VHAETYASLMPNSRLAMLPSCGHLVPLEQADAFARLTVEFLSA
jgi:pimeloyl-ACP methyl ester carboxylesterase